MTNLQTALEQELTIYKFGRSGNSLPPDQPAFTAVVLFVPANDRYKIRIASPLATYQSHVQPSFEPASAQELSDFIAKIEAYDPEELIRFINQFVPQTNKGITP